MMYFEGSSFNAAKADSSISNLSPASRLLASGPWHLKHLSDKMGLTWKLKSTWSGMDVPASEFEGLHLMRNNGVSSRPVIRKGSPRRQWNLSPSMAVDDKHFMALN
jgi:hypothetical protein